MNLVTTPYTVVPALGDPRRERPPVVYGHVNNVPTHFNVKLPAIGRHLRNADADSHLLVVRTCYNGQCKQIPRFRWSFQPKSANSTYRSRQSCHCGRVEFGRPVGLISMQSSKSWLTLNTRVRLLYNIPQLLYDARSITIAYVCHKYDNACHCIQS